MKDKILITGGTGSIGSAVALQASLGWDITIFSNNEREIIEMKAKYPMYEYVLGDVTNYGDLARIMSQVAYKYLFHFAALKHVEICEKQPTEAIQTNLRGTLNVINACLKYGVKMVNMSSDKAINPTNIYGMTKYLGECMATQSGFVSIRSGNVLWSSGSVLLKWKKQLEAENKISITDKGMTRFFISPEEIAKFIIYCRDEVGVQTVSMDSYRLDIMANLFIHRYGNDLSEVIVTGLREGERLHEFREEGVSSEKCLAFDYDYIFQGA
jgi:UDP-N-acetylglucosamine 4,6-dehydratase/5-epimerase